MCLACAAPSTVRTALFWFPLMTGRRRSGSFRHGLIGHKTKV
jgi:hypothetical protein